MLVLSRKISERILVGEGVVVEVLEITGNKVKLGITAPNYVTIMREELLPPLAEESQRERGAACTLPSQARPLKSRATHYA